jgi:hypothetical protein
MGLYRLTADPKDVNAFSSRLHQLDKAFYHCTKVQWMNLVETKSHELYTIRMHGSSGLSNLAFEKNNLLANDSVFCRLTLNVSLEA